MALLSAVRVLLVLLSPSYPTHLSVASPETAMLTTLSLVAFALLAGLSAQALRPEPARVRVKRTRRRR